MKLLSASLPLLVSLIIGVTSAPLAIAENAKPEGAEIESPASNKAALALLSRMSKFYSGLSKFSYDVSTEENQKQGGKKDELKARYSIKVAKPSCLAIDVDREKGSDRTLGRLNGTELFCNFPPKGYVKDDASKVPADVRLGAVIASLTSRAATLFGFLGLFSDSDPMEALTHNDQLKLSQIAIVGDEQIDGVSTKHLSMINSSDVGLKWDIWIEDAEKPWLRRTFTHMVIPKKENEVTLVTQFSNWQDNPEFAENAFTFVPQAGMKQIETADIAASPESKLKGQAAPPVKLSTISGGTFDLADSKNKEVVVLDFWATWCPPCRAALPILTKVTKSYADKGVKFCAIDLGEDADTIKSYLKDQGLDVNVGLDSAGAIAKSYGVQGIPQSVIIGKDGMVKVVHVGLSADLETNLPKELDAVLSGKEPTE